MIENHLNVAIPKIKRKQTRAETGILQFENDWCGVFIRGDSAAYYRMCLENFISLNNKFPDILTVSAIKQLAALLGSCIEPINQEEKIQKAKLIGGGCGDNE